MPFNEVPLLICLAQSQTM